MNGGFIRQFAGDLPVKCPTRVKSPVKNEINIGSYDSWRKYTLQWRHMKVKLSQIVGNSTVCLTVYVDRHQRNIKSALLAFCEGNSPMTSEFPAPRVSNAEKASICWRHHGMPLFAMDVSFVFSCFSLFLTKVCHHKCRTCRDIMWCNL